MSHTMDLAAIPGGAVFSVDVAKREIRGRAVPYGVVGLRQGKKFQFARGTVHPREGMVVKLWALHDHAHAAGVVTEWDDTDEGLDVAFAVARTPEGDRALAQADSGVWDGLSIGPSEGATYRLTNGVHHAVDIPIHEISLTPAPVFGGARVTSVAFDITHEENPMPEETETPTTTGTEVVEEAPATFDAAAVITAITDGFASLANPQGREVVSAGSRLEITEPAPYRFDGATAEHDFSTDVFSAIRGDGEARGRVQTFMADELDPVTFAAASADVAALNPVVNRPDLYVDRLVAATPLWQALRKGSLTNNTPFVFPKFESSSGLVADHVEMVEPSSGTFKATKQTVTPSPLSGKVEIPREVVDAGGNPQVSRLIWREMERAYYEALETKVSALLAAANPTAIALPAGATDATLVSALEDAYADLQFVPGGFRFDYAPTHQGLYKRLAAAVDTTGRKLLPIIGPTNATGTTAARFASLEVAGVSHLPVASLAGTNADGPRKSYLLASEDVHAWASPPRELRFEWRVAHIDLGIWGYVATAISRLDGVRAITYNRVGA